MITTDESLRRFKELEWEMWEVFEKAKEARRSEIDELRKAKREIDDKIECIQTDILGQVLDWLKSKQGT